MDKATVTAIMERDSKLVEQLAKLMLEYTANDTAKNWQLGYSEPTSAILRDQTYRYAMVALQDLTKAVGLKILSTQFDTEHTATIKTELIFNC